MNIRYFSAFTVIRRLSVDLLLVWASLLSFNSCLPAGSQIFQQNLEDP